MRICTTCKTGKELTSFYNRKDRAGLSAYSSKCIACTKIKNQLIYKENKEKILKDRKEYYLLNSESVKIRAAKWRDKNYQKIRGYVKKWDSKNKDKKLKIYISYKNRNPHAVIATQKKWRDGNKDKVLDNTRKRRARKISATGSFTSKDVADILKLQSNKCACCRMDVKRKYHADHVIPLSKGGSNDRLNIQVLCASCNLKKGSMHPIDFMQKKGYLL